MTAGGDYDLAAMASDNQFQYLLAQCCGKPGTAYHEGKLIHGFAYKESFFFHVPEVDADSSPARTVWRPPQ